MQEERKKRPELISEKALQYSIQLARQAFVDLQTGSLGPRTAPNATERRKQQGYGHD